MRPETLNHYRVLRTLGSGGMGEVDLAEDTKLHRNVAIKVLLENAPEDRDRRERFGREARAVAALSHPNIVTIHSVEEDAGRLFLTMEYVDGRPLTEVIPSDGLSLDKLLAIAIPLAIGARYASGGIVSRGIHSAAAPSGGRPGKAANGPDRGRGLQAAREERSRGRSRGGARPGPTCNTDLRTSRRARGLGSYNEAGKGTYAGTAIKAEGR